MFRGIFVEIPQHYKGHLIYVLSTWKIASSHAVVLEKQIWCVSIHATSVFRGSCDTTRSLIYSIHYIILWKNWRCYDFWTVWRGKFNGKIMYCSRKLMYFGFNWWLIYRQWLWWSIYKYKNAWGHSGWKLCTSRQ